MVNELVAKDDPFVLWNKPHKVLFDLIPVFFFGETQTSAYPFDVSVHNHTGGNSVGGTEHYICRFTSDAGKLRQEVNIAGYLPLVFFGEYLAALADHFGFIAEKAGGLDILFELLLGNPGIIACRAVLLEQRLRYLVNPLIRTLSGKNSRNEKL